MFSLNILSANAAVAEKQGKQILSVFYFSFVNLVLSVSYLTQLYLNI